LFDFRLKWARTGKATTTAATKQIEQIKIFEFRDIRECCLTEILSDGIVEHRFHGHDVKTVFSACPESIFPILKNGRDAALRRPLPPGGQRSALSLPRCSATMENKSARAYSKFDSIRAGK
jgi:hypothetical protein